MTDNETKLPETIEELNELIQAEVSKNAETLSKKHSDEMANLRKKAKEEKEQAIAKAKEDATMTADEKAKKEREEEFNLLKEENEKLKLKAHNGEVKDALSKSNLPLFLANDSRLVNAKNDEELASAIEQVKNDYTSSIPSGSQINTNVVAGQETNSEVSKANAELERFRTLGIK